MAYDAQVEVIAVLSEHGDERRAREMLRNAALAYQGYDNPAGASFKAGKVRPVIPETEPFPPARGMWQSRNVLGVRELASLWHPLGSGNQPAGVTRSAGPKYCRHLPRPCPKESTWETPWAAGRASVHLPEDAIRRNQFLVARTRMGKSTLMHHVVTHLMREKAAGRNDDAIIVVDPHADLVQGPPEAGARVHHRQRLPHRPGRQDQQAPGINLLDTRVFPDRDRTADSVVRVAHGLWEQWGPRMQSILEHTVKSLHEYNCHPGHRGGRAAHHPGRVADAVRPEVPQQGPAAGGRPLHFQLVGQCLPGLDPHPAGRGHLPGADPAGLLFLVEEGAGHPSTQSTEK